MPLSIAEDATLNVKIDEASSTVTYIGHGPHGAVGSDSTWRILKITISGNVTSITYADGDPAFDNIWDNRASLSYS